MQVAPNLTLVDLSLKGLSPGRYSATIRASGDISRGPESTGDVWEAAAAKRESGESAVLKGRGILGTVDVGNNGIGSIFVDKPIQIWEIIGRSMVISRLKESGAADKLSKDDPDTLVGVIARSAGVWDNDKTVCSCSGKTVWEERKEQLDRGML